VIYDYWDKRLKVKDDDLEKSPIISQLTKREYRILTHVAKRFKVNKEEAMDDFIKEVLNSDKLPIFSDRYKAELMYNQQKRLGALRLLIEYINYKYDPTGGKYYDSRTDTGEVGKSKDS